MAILLYINDSLLDTDKNTLIAQTKQVNDLNSLDNRQANITNSFKIPKTSNNLKVLGYMTIYGNMSRIPYQKNECSLYSDSGECFVYKGWALITDSGDSFNMAVYDGIIDLYKAVENKSLADLDLSELVHEKRVAAVKATWTNTALPYRYILADYNGNTGQTSTGNVEIDYLVPSVSVAWLWDKIFTEHNFVYQGSVFDTFNFKELWMTYPKGLTITGENDHNVFVGEQWDYPATSLLLYKIPRWISASVNELTDSYLNRHLKVAESATYRLEINCTLYGRTFGSPGAPVAIDIRIGKNAEMLNSNDWPLSNYLSTASGLNVFHNNANNLQHGTAYNLVSDPFQLEAFDSICLRLNMSPGQGGSELTFNLADNNQLEVKLIRVDPNEIDFSDNLSDFAIKDFINEVVHRFGLTMFPSKNSNVLQFMTLQEQLQTSQVVNWSDKFSRKIMENYMYGTYAQKNYFRYNYNDKESTHHDGFITVDNVNLNDTRDVIKSKIYAPERQPSIYLGEQTNIYKLWDKEVVDNPAPGASPVNYKNLDKRYYFMRARLQVKDINLNSKALAQPDTAAYFYRENFNRLAFPEIIEDYYSPVQRILNDSVITTAELWLNDVDIVNFDFRKLYYIEQLSNYFLVNKIENYIPGRVTKCELVRVKYSDNTLPQMLITGVSVFADDVTISFINEYEGVTLVQNSADNITWYDGLTLSPISPYTLYNVASGTFYLRLKHDDVVSDVVTVVVP